MGGSSCGAPESQHAGAADISVVYRVTDSIQYSVYDSLPDERLPRRRPPREHARGRPPRDRGRPRTPTPVSAPSCSPRSPAWHGRPRPRRRDRGSPIAGDGGDGPRAAPPPRPAGAGRLRLREPAAADRPRPDDLAALHRRADDRPARPEARATSCSRSAPARATRRRCWPSWWPKVYTIEIVEPVGSGAAGAARGARLPERRGAHRRRLQRLAGRGAVRRHRRHRRRAVRPAAAGRPAQARRAPGDPGRRASGRCRSCW